MAGLTKAQRAQRQAAQEEVQAQEEVRVTTPEDAMEADTEAAQERLGGSVRFGEATIPEVDAERYPERPYAEAVTDEHRDALARAGQLDQLGTDER